jgi:hypothetical protein
MVVPAGQARTLHHFAWGAMLSRVRGHDGPIRVATICIRFNRIIIAVALAIITYNAHR